MDVLLVSLAFMLSSKATAHAIEIAQSMIAK
jgi:hypothetical protein